MRAKKSVFLMASRDEKPKPDFISLSPEAYMLLMHRFIRVMRSSM